MNGAMKTAPARLTSMPASSEVMLAAWNAAKMISAFLNTLSLPAERNWVQKNGAKRRSFSRSNWFGGCITSPGGLAASWCHIRDRCRRSPPPAWWRRTGRAGIPL